MAHDPMTDHAAIAWPDFGGRLADTLRVLSADQFLILTFTERGWFVQFAMHGEAGIRAEMVSNAFLDMDNYVDADDLRLAESLGWKPPTGAPGESTPATDPDGSPNYFTDWDHPVDLDQLAALATTTLQRVFHAESADALSYSAFADGGATILLPTLGIDRSPDAPDGDEEDAETAARVAEVRAAVLGAMREEFEDEIEPDEDGDLPLRFDSAMVFVRVGGNPLTVRVYAEVLADVSHASDLLEAVNQMNSEHLYLRWFVVDNRVKVNIDLSAEPLCVQHVIRACWIVGQAADTVDEQLQGSFGGRTFFGQFVPPKLTGYGGYL